MPLNLNTSFKRRVEFTKRSQKCRWVSHFTGCAREVVGALELLAKNREDRFIFAGVDAIVQLCNKEYQVKGQPPVQKYSKRHVEDCLKVFRELQILSYKTTAEVDGVPRKGRYFNPHDSVTTRYPLACVFIGGGKKPGTWANGIWQEGDAGQFGGLVIETTPDTTPGVEEVTCEITVPITCKNTVSNTGSITVPITGSTVDETPQKSPASSSKQRSSGDLQVPEPIQPIKPAQPSEPIEPPQPPEPRSAPEWLSWLWLTVHLHSSSDDEPSKHLALRPPTSLRSPSPQASPAGRPGESPDVAVIEELIAQEPYVKKEAVVRLAWAEFCLHHKHDPLTKFPVTVFKTNYQAYRMGAMEAIRRLKEFKQRSDAMKLVDDYLAEQKTLVTPDGRSEVRQ